MLSDVRSSCQAAALVEMKHGFFERDGSAMETVAGHVEWARQLPAVLAGSEQYGRDACAVLGAADKAAFGCHPLVDR